MTTLLPENERELVAKTDEIRKHLAVLSQSFQKISSMVAELHEEVGDPALIENLLLVRAEVAPADARLFASCGKLLAQNPALGRQIVSPETMRLLAGTSGETRSEAIGTLINGQLSDADKISKIESFVRWVREGDERTEASGRAAYLEFLARGSAATAISAFETLADELIHSIHEFIHAYVPPDPSEGLEAYTDLDSYAAAHRDITVLAAMVLAEFDVTFGSPAFPGDRDEGHPERKRLAKAYRALFRFAEGRFAHDGGFAFDAERNAIFSSELVDALEYLGSNVPEELEQTVAQSGAPEQLRVVEFGAGAGGMAIGLMAGGFRHRAMFESVKKRVNTLRKNWPNWPVREASITKLSDQALQAYQGVDLVAANIPGQPFARSSKAEDRQSEHNHFPDVLRAIRIVGPRAFIFHVVKTATFAQHAAYLAGVCTDLSFLGYKVEQVRLQSRSFGLPHEMEHLVIVGIRNSERGTFLAPVLRNPITRGVSEVLGPALVLHETPAELKNRVERYSDQWYYDQWAKDWQRWYRDASFAVIPKNMEEMKPGPLDELKKAGIDGLSYADEPPKVGEVKDNHLRPRLTVAAIALAQSFPPNWSFEAELSGNIDMIAEALPPVLAKALGLRIFAALTGWRIDLDAALAGPVISEARIGKRSPRLRPEWITYDRVLKADELIEGEDALADIPDPKERASARARLLAKIAPLKRGRGAQPSKDNRAAIVRIAVRTRSSRESGCHLSDE
jgi:site-specific DNA-cytosine methylase